MYTRYYDSYPAKIPDKSEPAQKESKEALAVQSEETAPHTTKDEISTASVLPNKIFGNLNIDDVLLIALIFITASDASDDFLMPLILGALLLG